MAPPSRRPLPHVQVRISLAESRAAGIDFTVAWDTALREVKWPHDTGHRRQWREALRVAREEYEAAYEGRETNFHRTGMALAAALEERAQLDRTEYDLIAVAA